jgi:hypothetical protein
MKSSAPRAIRNWSAASPRCGGRRRRRLDWHGPSLMGMGLLNSRLPEGEGFKVIASFGYCAGFLAVILARQQLFTKTP